MDVKLVCVQLERMDKVKGDNITVIFYSNVQFHVCGRQSNQYPVALKEIAV